VLISGAAHGVGAACARLLAQRGADLVLSDIDGAALSRLASELGCSGWFCDVASESSVEIFARRLAREGHPLDVLVNAAGPAYVRSLGMLRLSAALLPCLSRGERGSQIVNVASATQSSAQGGGFRYASSREAFARLSLALGDQLRSRGIMVQTVFTDPRRASEERVAAEIADGIDGFFPPITDAIGNCPPPSRRSA